jgi:hypothetical protein
MQARYFGGALGRFLSPDPRNAEASLTNPQSWNAYSYVGNNPLAAVDPSGTKRLPGFSPEMLQMFTYLLSQRSAIWAVSPSMASTRALVWSTRFLPVGEPLFAPQICAPRS